MATGRQPMPGEQWLNRGGELLLVLAVPPGDRVFIETLGGLRRYVPRRAFNTYTLAVPRRTYLPAYKSV